MSWHPVPTRSDADDLPIITDLAYLQANLSALLSGMAPWDAITTPAVNPPSGSFFIYFKSDGKLYKLNHAGVETSIPATAATYPIRLLLCGGGAGASAGSAGGGAGEFVAVPSIDATIGSIYTITIGGGGARTSIYIVQGNDGSPSSISGPGISKTALGGGGGGSFLAGNGNPNGRDGGSGGGSGSGGTPGASIASDGVGHGGGAESGSASEYWAGGGGGAGVKGQDAAHALSYVGAGGDGLEDNITGANLYYCGGGGAGGYTVISGKGGLGGGGGGSTNSGTAGASDTSRGATASGHLLAGDGGPNTGSGGGGATPGISSSGAGGSGVCIIRYTSATQIGTGGDSVYQDGSDWVHVYTNSGIFTI